MLRQILFFIFLLITRAGRTQDTFSIVALDSTSREVGSAGASCLDLFFAGYSDPSFLTRLIPDTGAVNIQSYFMQANQDNAVQRLRMGDNAMDVINWLVANDANNNPEFKQHGVVTFNGGMPSSAAHSGATCINYKNHITGSIQGFYYAIQGNILQGQHILDSMEQRFRHENGNLACRLMAAMQGAKIPGADTRCLSQGISSKFAFLQVAKPMDTYGFPSLNVGLRTTDSEVIEPIDSLQILFNQNVTCYPVGLAEQSRKNWTVYPNPNAGYLQVQGMDFSQQEFVIELYSVTGICVLQMNAISNEKIDIRQLAPGSYWYRLGQGLQEKRGLLILEPH